MRRNDLSRSRRNISGGLLLPLILLSAFLFTNNIQFAAEKETKKEPRHTVAMEHVATYDKKYISDILRFKYIYANWTLKYDQNPDARHEYAIQFNALNTNKNKLMISHLGSIQRTINGERLKQTYDFSFSYTRRLGKIPLFGESWLRLYHYNSLKRSENTILKYRIGLISSHWDFMYQYMLDRHRVPHSYFYGYYRDSVMALSIGKGENRRINATLVLKKPPVQSVAVWDYYPQTKEFQVYAFNALKNGDPNFYHEIQADLMAWLVILGDKNVNMFYVPTFLAFGDINQSILIYDSPEEIYISKQLGFRIKNRFGIGGGFLAKKSKPGPFRFSPVVSVYLKIPMGKNFIHLDARYEDKIVSVYMYMQYRF